jgi:branched-chain amino acid transport system ATP-binding protein
MTGALPILSVERLSVFYGKVAAVFGVSITLPRGSIVTIIGPNGAGKTTLVSALMGFLPSQGTVRYDGDAIEDVEVEERVARGISLVPEGRELFGELSVLDNLVLGAFPRYRRGDPDVDADLAAIFARFPRLRERRTQQASTLSGGERQMLAMGRALIAKPRVLLLDEPSIGLAPRIVHEVFRTIAELRGSGTSILLVEQNARAALRIADYAYVMENGRIALEGDAKVIAHDSQVIDKYLGISTGSHKSNDDGVPA